MDQWRQHATYIAVNIDSDNAFLLCQHQAIYRINVVIYSSEDL